MVTKSWWWWFISCLFGPWLATGLIVASRFGRPAGRIHHTAPAPTRRILLTPATRRTSGTTPASTGIVVMAAAHSNHNQKSNDTRKTNTSSSTTKVLDKNTVRTSSLERNRKILAYSDKKDWQAILTLFETEGRDFDVINFSTDFDVINFSTALARLARIRAVETKQDPRFSLFLDGLATSIWDQEMIPATHPRCYTNIVHALAKYNCGVYPATARIFSKLRDPYIAAGFVENANEQEMAETAWACTHLGFSFPAFTAAMEGRSLWLHNNNTYNSNKYNSGDFEDGRRMAQTARASAKLGYSSPILFAALENDRSRWPLVFSNYLSVDPEQKA
jgi:hypothetical protein